MPSPTKDPFPRLAPPTAASKVPSASPSRSHPTQSSQPGRSAQPTTATTTTNNNTTHTGHAVQTQPLLHSAVPTHSQASPHRTLRKLASAHNLGYGSAANLRASIANPPSLIAQQRSQQYQHQHQPHHQQHQHPQARRNLSSRRSFSPARRHASITASPLNTSPLRGSRAASAAATAQHLNAAAAAMSSLALRNTAILGGRTAYDHIPLEKLIRDGPPDGDWASAVQCARMKVLQQEIKSDSDGMVSCNFLRRTSV